MNKQQIFTAAVTGIMKQGKPGAYKSKYTGMTCQYRTSDGAACAIGQLIPEDKYCAEMEPFGPKQALTDAGIELDEDVTPGFLDELQAVHDCAAARADDFLADFRARAGVFATHHGLEMPV